MTAGAQLPYGRLTVDGKPLPAVSVPVPDLDTGVRFYGQASGHRLKWRNHAGGRAGLELPDGDSELVLTTRQSHEPKWLVDDVDDAVALLGPPWRRPRRRTV
jgi:hypothetical protein